MALFVIAILLAFLGIFCRAPHAKRLLWGTALLAAIAASSFLWTSGQFVAAGCEGDLRAGLSCPEPGLLTKVAIAHLSFGMLALAAGVFAAPAVMMIAIWLELRFRRQATS